MVERYVIVRMNCFNCVIYCKYCSGLFEFGYPITWLLSAGCVNLSYGTCIYRAKDCKSFLSNSIHILFDKEGSSVAINSRLCDKFNRLKLWACNCLFHEICIVILRSGLARRVIG